MAEESTGSSCGDRGLPKSVKKRKKEVELDETDAIARRRKAVENFWKQQPHLWMIITKKMFAPLNSREQIKSHVRQLKDPTNLMNKGASAWDYTPFKYSRPPYCGRFLKQDCGRSSSGSVGRASSGTGRNSCGKGWDSSSCGSASSVTTAKYSSGEFPFTDELPLFIVPHISSWLDVKRDGNCGYRVVADIVYRDQERWREVRRDLFLEIHRRFDLYLQILKGKDRVGAAMHSLAHWDGPAPLDKWMTLLDMGLVIATRYNAVVLELWADQSFTYLPLRDDDQLRSPSFFIPIAFLRSQQHYIVVNIDDDCPIPPFYYLWGQYRDDSVAYIDEALSSRRRDWEVLRGGF